MSERLVIIGNGMAAARFVDELDKRARGRYAVAVIGAEPHLAYNRVLLSSLLAGEVEKSEIELQSADWWRSRGVTLLYGDGASQVDIARKVVRLATGREVEFSRLVFANGSSPARLSVPGASLAGVHTFRDLGDVAKMSRVVKAGTRVIVVGGGLLGLEAAYGVAKQGASVTLLHLMPHLMERQLDPPAARILQNAISAIGIECVCKAETTELEGEGHVERVRLRDGRYFEADLVIMALGVRPNTELAINAGIACNRGIIVDDTLSTSSANIFAIGECAEHRSVCYGLVEPAYEQARVLAERLSGRTAVYAGSSVFANLKVSGVNVFSAGDYAAVEDAEEIVLSDASAGVYKRLVIRKGKLTGAVLTGDTSDGLWYLDLIRSGASITSIRDDLAFGRISAIQDAA